MAAHWKGMLLACLSVKTTMTNGCYTNPPDPAKLFECYGSSSSSVGGDGGRRRRRTIHWSYANPVPIQKEIKLFMSGALLRRGEYGPLIGSRALEVKLECAELDIDFDQALCIRKQLLLGKVLKGGSCRLKDNATLKSIKKDFEVRRRPILEISKIHDLPPVSIMRSILSSRVSISHPQFTGRDKRCPGPRMIRSIINEDEDVMRRFLLSEWEVNELRIAKEHDVIGYDDAANDAGGEWERTIYDYLDRCGIRYITEETLRCYGYHEGAGTPDCLLLDDVYIHGRHVRWIEFKSFYASGLKETSHFTKKAVGRQVEKYCRAYGKDGAVIMKHGFSAEVSGRYPSTLFLDGGSLNAKDAFNL